jgi:hypothetical protein
MHVPTWLRPVAWLVEIVSDAAEPDESSEGDVSTNCKMSNGSYYLIAQHPGL